MRIRRKLSEDESIFFASVKEKRELEKEIYWREHPDLRRLRTVSIIAGISMLATGLVGGAVKIKRIQDDMAAVVQAHTELGFAIETAEARPQANTCVEDLLYRADIFQELTEALSDTKSNGRPAGSKSLDAGKNLADTYRKLASILDNKDFPCTTEPDNPMVYSILTDNGTVTGTPSRILESF